MKRKNISSVSEPEGTSRNGQVVRILHVIRVLERNPQGIGANEVHEALTNQGFSQSLRTIYRDLEAIQEAHFPLETIENDAGEKKWRFNSVASIAGKIQISYEEIIALYISKECLAPLKGTPFFKDIQTFFDKVEKLLGPKVQAELLELSNSYSFRASPMWTTGVPNEILDIVHRACAEGHELAIDYRSNNKNVTGKISTRKVGPIGIYLADSSIYLIAKDLADGVIKKFALVRIRSAHWTETAFENDKSFSVEDFYKDDFGVLSSGEVAAISLRITEPMASYVSERRWHQSQRITRLDENTIELTLKVKVNQELARWVLSLGENAKVLSPDALSAEVSKIADGVSMLYRRKKAA